MKIVNTAEPLWVERYRPQTLDDCILDGKMRALWSGFVMQGLVPNCTLTGLPGTGKTSVAIAALTDLNADYIFINAARDSQLEVVREKISNFCMTRSTHGRKYVILDEVENLRDHTQGALRGAIESFATNAGFILTCNDLSAVSEPIQSRCQPIHFRRTKMPLEAVDRLTFILDREKIEFEPKALLDFAKTHWPDMRRIISGLQRFAAEHRRIDSGIFTQTDDLTDQVEVVFARMRSRDFQGVRGWITQNVSRETLPSVLRGLFAKALTAPWSQPSMNTAILELGHVSDVASHCIDVEITMMAALTRIMHNAEWNQ